MLLLNIPEIEIYNENDGTFTTITSKEIVISMEHSLVSISKWEDKYKKPFFDNGLDKYEKNNIEILDYLKMMTITQNVKDEIYTYLPEVCYKKIIDYINDSHTATWFSNINDGKAKNGFMGKEIITSEIIYYWMISLNIPLECQKWNINRLLTLIRVINEKNKPQKKIGKNELRSRNAALNARRRAKLNSRG